VGVAFGVGMSPASTRSCSVDDACYSLDEFPPEQALGIQALIPTF
jgi:hypothetical protein